MANIPTSLNKIYELFNDLVNRHEMVNDFGVGPTWNLNSSKLKFPYIWLENLDSTVERGEGGYKSKFYSFNLYCMDKINKGDDNYNEIISDADYILDTIIKEIGEHPNYRELRMKIDDDIEYTPVIEETNDNVNGWSAQINIRVPLLVTYCNSPIIPYNTLPVIDCGGGGGTGPITYNITNTSGTVLFNGETEGPLELVVPDTNLTVNINNNIAGTYSFPSASNNQINIDYDCECCVPDTVNLIITGGGTEEANGEYRPNGDPLSTDTTWINTSNGWFIIWETNEEGTGWFIYNQDGSRFAYLNSSTPPTGEWTTVGMGQNPSPTSVYNECVPFSLLLNGNDAGYLTTECSDVEKVMINNEDRVITFGLNSDNEILLSNTTISFLTGASNYTPYPIAAQEPIRLSVIQSSQQIAITNVSQNYHTSVGHIFEVTVPDASCSDVNLAIGDISFGSYEAGSNISINVKDSEGTTVDASNVNGELIIPDLPCATGATGGFPKSVSQFKGIDSDFEPEEAHLNSIGDNFYNLNETSNPALTDHYLWPSNGYKRFTGKTGGYYNEVDETFHLSDGTTTTKANAFPDAVFLDWAQAAWEEESVPMFQTNTLDYGSADTYTNKLAEIEAATIAGETGWTVPTFKMLYNLSIEFGNFVFRYEPIADVRNTTIHSCTRRSTALFRGVATVAGNGASNNLGSSIGLVACFKNKSFSELTV